MMKPKNGTREHHPSIEDDPKLWSIRKKRTIVAIVGFAALLSPVSLSIYYPAVADIQAELHTSATLVNATVSSFIFLTGVATLFWASFSDAYGRRTLYVISILIYIVSTTMCAMTDDIWVLIVGRGFQACGASATLSMGAGTLGLVVESGISFFFALDLP
jgi:MFS family permease